MYNAPSVSVHTIELWVMSLLFVALHLHHSLSFWFVVQPCGRDDLWARPRCTVGMTHYYTFGQAAQDHINKRPRPPADTGGSHLLFSFSLFITAPPPSRPPRFLQQKSLLTSHIICTSLRVMGLFINAASPVKPNESGHFVPSDFRD